ncbi:MAG: hypothetical protein ABDH20_11725 [Thermus sp.]
MRRLAAGLVLLLAPAWAGGLGYGFLGYQGGFQGGGGGLGTVRLEGLPWAFGGEGYGGAGQRGGVFYTGPLLRLEGVYLLPLLGLGGEERNGAGGFLVEVGVRAFYFPQGTGPLLGLGLGYGLGRGGPYLRLLFGGGAP